MRLYPLFRPLAFALDAERAHRATIAAVKLLPPRRPPDFPASLLSSVGGLEFPTPLGLAAGFMAPLESTSDEKRETVPNTIV